MITTYSRLFILSATALCMSGLAHAQAADVPVRDSVVINKGGYAVLDKTPTAGDVDFANKSKVVRDAFRKREIRRQLDERNLPPVSMVVNTPSKGPLR